MWYACVILVMTSAACGAAPAAGPAGVATTTRRPQRTLERNAGELAWGSWLQSPESFNINDPPRRITTKSLFITPLVCPKGERLDRSGCIPNMVTVNREEHEKILVDQLNSIFSSSPPKEVLYDYEEGPFQLSIPIGLEPLAAPLQASDANLQPPEWIPNSEKKNEDIPGVALNIEAELEKLKHEQTQKQTDDSLQSEKLGAHLNAITVLPDKPKRDSPVANTTETNNTNTVDEGQKEHIYGNINFDPVLIYQNQQAMEQTVSKEATKKDDQIKATQSDININNQTYNQNQSELIQPIMLPNKTQNENITETTEIAQELKKDNENAKLNPETDYSDFGEAIKLISRYAEVTTDDNFSKDLKKSSYEDSGILGTRTKLQHRRNKFKTSDSYMPPLQYALSAEIENRENSERPHSYYPKSNVYFRYPWPSHSQTPPPNYPFRHLQDYWPGRTQFGGVYNAGHENPRRHHHSYIHNYRQHGYPSYGGYGTGQGGTTQESYPGQIHDQLKQLAAAGPRTSGADLRSLLGLRHWFSSEGHANR